MYEVNSSNQVVWQYNAGPAKAFRYLCSDPGIIALLGPDPCGLATDVNEADEDAAFGIYPNPTEGMLNLTGVDMTTMERFVVYDGTGREVKRTAPGWTVDVGDLPDGVYQVVVEHDTGRRDVRRVVVQH
jgi:hypothetical protein